MSANGYQFVLEFFTDKGSVAQVPVTPDWQSALECARFAGIRRGVLPPVAAGPGTIEPIWNGEVGAPYVAGPRIVWARAPGSPLAVTTVDVVDVGRGTSQPVTSDCPFIGATIRHVVFGCRDAGSRVVSVDDLKADDLKAFFFRADPHAILGRARDRWTVTPVAN